MKTRQIGREAAIGGGTGLLMLCVGAHGRPADQWHGQFSGGILSDDRQEPGKRRPGVGRKSAAISMQV
jgi:hypothetical protein